MGTMASQITSLTIVYSIVYLGADQRELQSSASLAFVRGNHRGPVNSPHKGSVTRKMFPFDDVIMHWSDLCVKVDLLNIVLRKWRCFSQLGIPLYVMMFRFAASARNGVKIPQYTLPQAYGKFPYIVCHDHFAFSAMFVLFFAFYVICISIIPIQNAIRFDYSETPLGRQERSYVKNGTSTKTLKRYGWQRPFSTKDPITS